jgi:allophanate hydrolase
MPNGAVRSYAGAIIIGKTNMDQFASGLVGTRTPFGVPVNPFDHRFITGGSSSGSGAAVGRCMVTFAIGTDTAGSGRIPAGFNGCVGIKPTLGSISVVGACNPARPSMHDETSTVDGVHHNLCSQF